eukprot:TRINITY_DN8929_c3_g1_i1.p4 TRINITY_DN8929_c3_g1~~TRINITY_DN8929_c3_g1_i1.p4  ORF type:complete len:120 (+),score=1.63 TRINITY_DN8929_c3_g1_i1:68-427(+)
MILPQEIILQTRNLQETSIAKNSQETLSARIPTNSLPITYPETFSINNIYNTMLKQFFSKRPDKALMPKIQTFLMNSLRTNKQEIPKKLFDCNDLQELTKPPTMQHLQYYVLINLFATS